MRVPTGCALMMEAFRPGAVRKLTMLLPLGLMSSAAKGVWGKLLPVSPVVMNFFISSGSAKVFLLLPLIVPLAEIFGISGQLCVMAFAFGDGFSNVFYPTNPVLLIGLSMAGVSYPKWVKWTWKLQLLIFAQTVLILLFGVAIGY